MSVRGIVLRRIQDKFFNYLRRGPFRSWDISLLLKFSRTVVGESRGEIFSYLKNKDVTIHNIEKITDEIISKILVPHMEKIKFED